MGHTEFGGHVKYEYVRKCWKKNVKVSIDSTPIKCVLLFFLKIDTCFAGVNSVRTLNIYIL